MCLFLAGLLYRDPKCYLFSSEPRIRKSQLNPPEAKSPNLLGQTQAIRPYLSQFHLPSRNPLRRILSSSAGGKIIWEREREMIYGLNPTFTIFSVRFKQFLYILDHFACPKILVRVSHISISVFTYGNVGCRYPNTPKLSRSHISRVLRLRASFLTPMRGFIIHFNTLRRSPSPSRVLSYIYSSFFTLIQSPAWLLRLSPTYPYLGYHTQIPETLTE